MNVIVSNKYQKGVEDICKPIFSKYIDDPQIVKEIEKHFGKGFLHLPSSDSEYYNCFAYLRFAEKQVAAEEGQ